MSIGNLKDSGNQGNNFPYQLAVLRGLAISQCSKLTEYYIEEASSAALTTEIQVVLDANPNSYLVSKSIAVTSTGDYIAFLTLSTL
jgi:hypothetical protein